MVAAFSVPDPGTTFRDLAFPRTALAAERGLLDLEQELGVALGLAHLLHEQLESLLGLQRVQHAAQLPDDLELIGREQDLFLTSARRVHVNRREEPLLRELAAQPQLHVAGALELLEDDLVHPGAGLDQGRGQDGQRAAVLDVARRTEEPLGRVQRGGVHATGEDAAAGGRRVVVGAAQPGDVVEQDDHVVAHLHQPLGPLDGQLGHGGVVVGRVVEGRVDDLALDRALHVGDLFWPLVDQDDHEVALGVVLGDRDRDSLQDHRLARLGRRHDQAALALADGADQVDDPGGHVARIGLQAEPVLRVQRHQLGEVGPGGRALGVQAVDLVQPDQRVELLPAVALARLADRAFDDVALAQAVLAHLGQGDVDVVRPGQVAGGPDERVALALEHVQDAGDRDEHVILGDHGLGVALPFAAPVPVPEPVAAAAPAAVPVVVAELVAAARAAARSRRLPAVAALVPAALVPAVAALVPAVTALVPAVAALVAAALVPVAVVAGLLAAALVPADRLPAALAGALVTGALIAGALVAAGLVAGAGRLAVPAAAVAALSVALPGLGGRGGRRTVLGHAVPAGGRVGLLVEAELLLGGAVSTDADGGSGVTLAEAGLRASSDARSRVCVWFHGVLLLQAGRVGSRGRGTLVRTLLAKGDDPAGLAACGGGPRPLRRGTSGTGLPAGASALVRLNRLDELALAHPAGAGDGQGLRDALQLGHEQRGEAGASATARLGRRCRRSCGRGGILRRGWRAAEDFGCVAH